MKVLTQYPIAHASLDHQIPEGTKKDNCSELPFIEEIESRLGSHLSILDLGCAGGQMVVDFYERGHNAVGLEGSDYSVVNKRANWPKYHNTVLFTCDCTKPFTVSVNDENKPCQFDLITAWEFMEHIAVPDLPQLLRNVEKHLRPGGLFIGTANVEPCIHHVTLQSGPWWFGLFSGYFEVVKPYPFVHSVRHQGFRFACRRRERVETDSVCDS